MSSFVPPKKNAAFTFYVSLVSQADTKIMQANPTLAAGDVKVAVDDAAPGNLATLPAVDADFTKRVKVSLSAAEMNGDNITVIFSDAAGAEWCDQTINLQTTARQIDDLAWPTTTGRSIDVTAAGEVGLDLDNTSGTIAAAQIATDAITAAKIAAGAITASEAPNLDAAISTRATPAQVNTEVSDVMKTDTVALPGQGTPTATPTMEAILGWIYKTFRNKKEQTATEWRLFNDAGTVVDSKATVSDDATTATKEEIASGP